MKYDYQLLKGYIKKKYNNQEDLAKVMKISDTSLSNKLNNRTHFAYDEVKFLMEHLEIKKEEIVDVFFKTKC